ncbi:MAG: MMPL family transporter [Marivibrio sp.]|uniref:MMPL family transporter n=1 Tax=Marivibrio sp. TaxID=2039719 RepID=UPI0032ECE0E2
MIDRFSPRLKRFAAACARRAAVRPKAVLAAAWGLAAACVALAAATLEVEPEATALIPADTPFLETYEAYKREFTYDRRTNIVVIDAPGADQAAAAQLNLQNALEEHGALFNAVRAPDSSEFMRRRALLYLETERLETLADRLLAAQPAIAVLAKDPSLRGVADIYEGAVARDAAEAPDLAEFLADAAERTLADAPPAASWSSLLLGAEAAPSRRLLLVQGRLDGAEQEVGGDTSRVIRSQAQALGLTAENGYRVRLTGRGPLSAEEVDGMIADIQRAGLISLALVAAVMWVGFRSSRMIATGVLTLLTGLAWTAGYAALAVGSLNLLSVVFAVLFIGLGIDFAIHFALRYREEAAFADGADRAAARTGGAAAGALTLCAITSAVGFLAFLPTDFRGLAELGLISAGGMVLALVASYTVMPALLTLLGADGLDEDKGRVTPGGVKIARWIDRRARAIRLGALALGVVAAGLSTQIAFDFNTLSLKDPNAESIAALRDLQEDGTLTAYSLSITAETPEAANAIAKRLSVLPEVATAKGPASLVPDGQDVKLAIVRDLAASLWPALNPAETRPALDAAGRLAAVQRLRATAAAAQGPQVERLAEALSAIEKEGEAAIAGYAERLTDRLPAVLQRLKDALQAERTTLADVPDALKARYVSDQGRGRAVATPTEDVRDFRALRRFVEAVTALYPDATGRPALEAGVGRIVTDAFLQAVATAAAAVFLLVWALLGSARAAGAVILPLALAASVLGGYSVLFDRPFNSTNVIVIPLILGLGVDNGLHFVMRWREETSLALLMRSSTPRAALLSGATTIASFATLMLSDNRGVAGMGEFLTIGVAAVLLASCLVLPALLLRENSAERLSVSP